MSDTFKDLVEAVQEPEPVEEAPAPVYEPTFSVDPTPIKARLNVLGRKMRDEHQYVLEATCNMAEKRIRSLENDLRMAREAKPRFDLKTYVRDQWIWSTNTFGSGKRTEETLDQVEDSLDEVEASPEDLRRWINVAIRALDGYARHGGTPASLVDDLIANQVHDFSMAPKSSD